MTLDELIEKLTHIKQKYNGKMVVILDTDLVVAELGNIRVPDDETVVLEV